MIFCFRCEKQGGGEYLARVVGHWRVGEVEAFEILDSGGFDDRGEGKVHTNGEAFGAVVFDELLFFENCEAVDWRFFCACIISLFPIVLVMSISRRVSISSTRCSGSPNGGYYALGGKLVGASSQGSERLCRVRP